MLARIEPENNIELILEAFSKMPDQKLVIAGRWETSEFGRTMREKYKIFDNLMLLDAIYNQTKLSLLRSNCKLYVHGHSVGGTNPSLVEAMCVRLPVAAFDASYNRATTEDKALYFNSVDSLITIVNEFDSSKQKIGDTMKEIADRCYTWNVIRQKYEALYI
jgi:glycosyltransferase involved in cell wall biosynthesis